MWLFTKYGFFSAVCARKGDGKHNQPIDADRIMIRARLRSHLEALRERFHEVLDSSPVLQSAGTDYGYRIFVPKATWTYMVKAIAEETAYDNFKAEVASYQGLASDAYERALHDVWSVMHKLQK